MKTMKVNPDQIITLNDYPVYNKKILKEYFNKCILGEKLAFVPVIRKNIVKNYFDENTLNEFKKFEEKYPKAEYFMLDGSHRTTASSLAHCKIAAVLYEKDKDVIEARKLIATGQILENGTLDHTLEKNCEILNKHFNEKPYFMTVEQKTKKMIRENILPKYMMDSYQMNNLSSLNQNTK
jgi:hypothetical protein